MWQCPICGRSFKRKDQPHYCSDKICNVDEYIGKQPERAKECLVIVRRILSEVLPSADEVISWSMPTFKEKRIIIQYAAFKGHLSLFPGPDAVKAFEPRLSPYKCSKGTIQFPFDMPLNENLIRDIALWCRNHR